MWISSKKTDAHPVSKRRGPETTGELTSWCDDSTILHGGLVHCHFGGLFDRRREMEYQQVRIRFQKIKQFAAIHDLFSACMSIT